MLNKGLAASSGSLCLNSQVSPACSCALVGGPVVCFRLFCSPVSVARQPIAASKLDRKKLGTSEAAGLLACWYDGATPPA